MRSGKRPTSSIHKRRINEILPLASAASDKTRWVGQYEASLTGPLPALLRSPTAFSAIRRGRAALYSPGVSRKTPAQGEFLGARLLNHYGSGVLLGGRRLKGP